MRSGRLRFPVEILQESINRDDAGAVFKTWTVIDTVRMDFDPQFGAEQVLRGREIDPATVRFRCRYRDDIVSTMRLRHDGVYYEITGKPADRNGRKRELLIPARVVTDGG